MTEALNIIYDIFAGMGMFVVLLICIAFIYGLIASSRAKKAMQKETEDLLGKLNPEMKKVYLQKMMRELEEESQQIAEGIKNDESKTEGS